MTSGGGTEALAGDLDHAEAVARAITIPELRTRALAELVSAAAQAGDLDRAHRLAADAEAVARAITIPELGARALAEVVAAAALAGDLDHAEAVARAITIPELRARALAEVVTAAALAGDLDHAEAVAWAIPRPGYQARALAGLVTAAAQAGDHDRAHHLAADAEAVARAITSPGDQARALADVAAAAAQAGDLDQAEAVARAITVPELRARALARLADAAAQAGDLDRTTRLAADAEARSRRQVNIFAKPPDGGTPSSSSPALGVLRIEIHGSWSVADLIKLLGRLEEGYKAAAALESLTQQPSGSALSRLSADDLLQTVTAFQLAGGLRLGSLHYGSPGFLELIGALNPLKTVKDGITENREINRKRDETRRLDEREREQQAMQHEEAMARESRATEHQRQSHELVAARLRLDAEAARFKMAKELISLLPADRKYSEVP